MSDSFIPSFAPPVVIEHTTLYFIIDPTTRIVATDAMPAALDGSKSPPGPNPHQRAVMVTRHDTTPRNCLEVQFASNPTADEIKSLMVYLQGWKP
jgi:hypothetical protein